MDRGVPDAAGMLTVVEALIRSHTEVDARRLLTVEGEHGGPVAEDLLGERSRVVRFAGEAVVGSGFRLADVGEADAVALRGAKLSAREPVRSQADAVEGRPEL